MRWRTLQLLRDLRSERAAGPQTLQSLSVSPRRVWTSSNRFYGSCHPALGDAEPERNELEGCSRKSRTASSPNALPSKQPALHRLFVLTMFGCSEARCLDERTIHMKLKFASQPLNGHRCCSVFICLRTSLDSQGNINLLEGAPARNVAVAGEERHRSASCLQSMSSSARHSWAPVAKY